METATSPAPDATRAPGIEAAAAERRRRLRAHFDAVAPNADAWRRRSAYYHGELLRLLRFVVPRGSNVLEVGCGAGELLAGLEPRLGVGLDLSPRMAARAHAAHPGVRWLAADAHRLPLRKPAGGFDFVVLSDLVGHLEDVWTALAEVRRVCDPHTRVIVTYYNFLWEPVFRLAERLGAKMPTPQQNWLGSRDLRHLLALAGFETVSAGERTLLPKRLWPLNFLGLNWFANRVLGKLPGLRHCAATLYLVARRTPEPADRVERSVTVLIPCRNERGNVADAVRRTPAMGTHTELLFVDGNSDDGTVAAIEAAMREHPERDIRLLHQGDGRGKGDAVRKGFAAARGDVLMILDADLTVPPEELPRFYDLLVGGRGEFVMGSRLIYPMEGQAMRFLNMVGNKFFSLAFSWLLDQRIKDTLCGTKVLLKADYDRIAANRHHFGDFDPFGDFDLIFGAAKLNRRIVEIPIRYRDRTYGETKISRWRHGLLLLRMCSVALRKLKLQ